MRLSPAKLKEKKLMERLARLGISKNAISETFVRSSGPGGQNVNKTASCVILQHIPTGTQVRCQKERSQQLNRVIALSLLLDKLEAEIKERELNKRQNKEKLMRQNRKKPLALKEQILQDKRYKTEKKQTRKKILFHKLDSYS